MPQILKGKPKNDVTTSSGIADFDWVNDYELEATSRRYSSDPVTMEDGLRVMAKYEVVTNMPKPTEHTQGMMKYEFSLEDKRRFCVMRN
ncbi:hypothetical protein HD806DRAFT_537940 [Xylariaceae sp. AK1471]|nr:hypothetical protein HD806DRAFT_537940 [Xylariaceae sp. AK1471]